MGYRNAKAVLPPQLLEELQRYAEGECLYIPCRAKRPGEAFETPLAQRNAQIHQLYRSGVSVQELAQRFFLSSQAIYKILSTFS